MRFDKETEDFINHEVRIRSVESGYVEIRIELKDLRKDMHSQFLWTIGTIITLFGGVMTLFGGVILHSAKLI